MEHIVEETGMTFFLKQYDFETEELIEIASRDSSEVGPISLWVSEEYVTWMDSYSSGKDKLTVFDVDT